MKKISKYRPSILQGTLQFEAARPRASLAIEHPFERYALTVFLAALGLLIACYLYFVTLSVLHVIRRTEALAEIGRIQSSTAELEQNYLALSQQISPQEAETLGLSTVTNTSYVYRPGNAALSEVASNKI